MTRGQAAGAAKMSLREWRRFRAERQKGMSDPAPTTAEAVWKLLVPWLDVELEDVSVRFPRVDQLTPEERAERAVVTKQALTVVFDVFVRAGRQRRTVTLNHVFDALARRWSDHFRRARDEGRAFQAYDMRRDTAMASRRDLLRNDIRLKALWQVAIGPWSGKSGCNPLYSVKRLPYGGYQVFLKDTPARQQFERLLSDDPAYRPDETTWRVLLADDPLPAREPRRQICAERAYNVVTLGPRARGLIDLQEQTRLLFDTEAFREDYEALEQEAQRIQKQLLAEYNFDPELSDWQPPPRRTGGRRLPSLRDRALRRLVPADRRMDVQAECEKYDRAQKHAAAFAAVYAQLDRLQPSNDGLGHVPIKSGFEILLNRRYQPVHFWPTWVSARPDKEGDPLLNILNIRVDWLRSSPRARWFRFRRDVYPADAPRDYRYISDWPLQLEGVDISSSQTQILAVLLGIGDLEALASDRSFKRYLAEHAWQNHTGLRDGYSGSDDPRLVALVKELWMRCLYGGVLRETIRDLYKEPLTYGPGWTADQAQRFLASVPCYPQVKQFLTACEQIAGIVDPYEGAIFTDPLDGVPVRWNPIARTDQAVASEGQRIILGLPGRMYRRVFKPAVANAAGDYPVDRAELRQKIAPCLVHMLDAYFSSLVMERLAARGVRDFVGINDCWYVPGIVPPAEHPLFGGRLLAQALREASEEWLTGLGPVYDRLLHYLGSDPEHGPFVRDIKAKWEARVREKRWPRFAAAESKLVEDLTGQSEEDWF